MIMAAITANDLRSLAGTQELEAEAPVIREVGSCDISIKAKGTPIAPQSSNDFAPRHSGRLLVRREITNISVTWVSTPQRIRQGVSD